jgi:radical SAM protein with 4Fe4S-binding SPASM domain
MQLLGADPTARPDLPELVQQASIQGVRVQLTACPADNVLDAGSLKVLSNAGAVELQVETDFAHRASNGSADRVAALARAAHDAGLKLVLRTVLHDGNVQHISAMLQDAQRTGAVRWVVGPRYDGSAPTLALAAIEGAMRSLAAVSSSASIEVCSIHAPFFMRVSGTERRPGVAQRDERWGLYVDVDGELSPDRSIPVRLGHVRDSDLLHWFQSNPLLSALRDPDSVEGKCGACRYRTNCGGSRARALAVTGNLFASDPACAFVA